MSNPLTEHALREVERILITGAREAYIGAEPEPGVPIDRRCVGCGVTRERCDDQECHQEWLRKEREHEHDAD